MPCWWADESINALASLPGFPPVAERAAREVLAAKLEAILFDGSAASTYRDQSEAYKLAQQVVDKMMEFDRWPGPAVFFQLVRRVRYGNLADAPTPPELLSQYLPPPPAEVCPQCDGFGYVVADGVYARCGCAQGAELQEIFLDMLNRRTAKVRGPGVLKRVTIPETIERGYSPITALDVERAVEARRIIRALETVAEEKLNA